MFKKKLNINKHWGKCCADIDMLDNKNSFYWLNKKNYKIVGGYLWMSDMQKTEIDNDINNNFLKLPQIVVQAQRYRELIKELNNSNVTKFFSEAKNEEEALYRYRCFIDWNGLELSEWYKSYLIIKDVLINWCNENNIRYLCHYEKPPKNYVYDGRDLSHIKWKFFYEELKYFS